MNLGRRQLGDFITLQCRCRDVSETPTLPTEAPWAEVWAGSTLIDARQIPIVDQESQTALFRFPLHLGGQFSTGPHTVLYNYVVGSLVRVDVDVFEIVAGGNADGAINAMTYYDKPQADFLVYKTDSGRLLRGKNPRL